MTRGKAHNSRSQPGYPSIQSFYQQEVEKVAAKDGIAPQEVIEQGDGFTEEELADALDPLNKKWNPEREYEQVGIGELVPGPKAVTFIGRIVNMSTIWGWTQKQPKAAGWHYILLKDNWAVISIKLYFSKTPYPLKLGQLLTIWTTFIAEKQANATVINFIHAYANLFPGRVTSDHLMIHTSEGTASLCRTPLGYRSSQPLCGLMTLECYLNGGHDGVSGIKLLVCVKSIGARRTITRKAGGGECDLATVLLLDHTGEMRWTIWSEVIDSAKEWQPGKTILLLSNPGYKVEPSGRGTLGIMHGTLVDVDPEFQGAEWLRRYVAGLTRRESLCLEFPVGRWDVDAAEYGANVILFTLAEIDEWVREDPRRCFTGHINVTIMELFLVQNHRRNMLMCTECCGVPIYANSLTTACRNCSKSLTLTVNPRIVGTLLDETGCIAPGKLLWSDRAWEQLLGRSIGEVAEMTADEVRWLEQRMLYLRCHLVVGWAEEVGRLAVLGMRA